MFSNPFLIQLSAVFTNLSSVFLSFTNFLKLSCTAGLLAVFLSQPSIDERSECTRVITMEFDRGLLRVKAVVFLPFFGSFDLGVFGEAVAFHTTWR
jgi:hypothetical protein